MHYLNDFLLFNYQNKSLFTSFYSYIDFKEKINKVLNDYIINFIDIKLDIDKLEVYFLKDKYNKAFKVVINILMINITFHKVLENLLKYFSFYARVISLE